MKKILIIFMSVFLVSLVSASLNVQLSDQGTGVSYNNGTVLDSANLSVLIYDASSGGNLVYNETFSNAISKRLCRNWLGPLGGGREHRNRNSDLLYPGWYCLPHLHDSFTSTTDGHTDRPRSYGNQGEN